MMLPLAKPMDERVNIPPALRDDLISYLLATSEERAPIIAELAWRNPRLADLLVALEAHHDLKARFEIELLPPERG
ncbi:MAG: hypothetical protein ACXWZF_00430 [Actinomycetota bacterium]